MNAERQNSVYSSRFTYTENEIRAKYYQIDGGAAQGGSGRLNAQATWSAAVDNAACPLIAIISLFFYKAPLCLAGQHHNLNHSVNNWLENLFAWFDDFYKPPDA